MTLFELTILILLGLPLALCLLSAWGRSRDKFWEDLFDERDPQK